MEEQSPWLYDNQPENFLAAIIDTQRLVLHGAHTRLGLRSAYVHLGIRFLGKRRNEKKSFSRLFFYPKNSRSKHEMILHLNMKRNINIGGGQQSDVSDFPSRT
jgi:hypothetical protein